MLDVQQITCVVYYKICQYSSWQNEDKFQPRKTLLPFAGRVQSLIAGSNASRDEEHEVVRFLRSLRWEGGQRRSIAGQREACRYMSQSSLVQAEPDEVFYCTAEFLSKPLQRKANLALHRFVGSKGNENLPGFISG